MPDSDSTFGLLGGDYRQIYLARAILRENYPVYLSCLEKAQGVGDMEMLGLRELLRRCQVIILPLPATRDGRYLNTPLSNVEIWLDDDFAGLFAGKTVLGGMMQKLDSRLWEKADCRDYYTREELVMGNAYLTAEGAIGLAVAEYPGAIGGANCLVTGFGRIGKALCGMLRGMGGRVFCAARKAQDLTAIRAMGCVPVTYAELGGDYELVFNTVPAQVLTQAALEKIAGESPGALLIELASQPGGIDLEAAGSLGLRVLAAGSLPGKMSPKASGELIKQTVFNMLAERPAGVAGRPERR